MGYQSFLLSKVFLCRTLVTAYITRMFAIADLCDDSTRNQRIQ